MEVYDKSGAVQRNDACVLSKWKGDFELLYSKCATPSDDEFLRYANEMNKLYESIMLDPLYEVKCNLNNDITLKEVSDVVMHSKNYKSAGSDNIPNEVLKFNCVIEALCKFFNICYDYGMVPEKWSEALISPILKSKNDDNRKL